MLSSNYTVLQLWLTGCAFGLVSVVLLILCVRKKKRHSVIMTSYEKTEENENSVQRSRASTNGTNPENQVDTQRLSQHSMPNEHRILPEIPKGTENKKEHLNGNPPTPEQIGVSTPGATSLDGTVNPGSPKKNRRLPALPPGGAVDVSHVSDSLQGKEIDDTYEDLRDDTAEPPETEVVGSGDSSLYAKVSGDLDPDKEEDNDLYAQVGDGDAGQKDPVSPTPEQKETRTSSSEEDKSMDTPSTVTYASVDKMKKTVSIRKSSPPKQKYGPPTPPPIPDRNFDEDDEASTDVPKHTPPPPVDTETQSTGTPTSDALQPSTSHEADESSGPAYDTLSVRESFAHQRLRQIVEEEQRNRYVNTNQAVSNGLEDSDQPEVYAQIDDDDNPEAVYESVSAPGSADGTVGVTGRLSGGAGVQGVEGGYVTIGNVGSRVDAPLYPALPNGSVSSPSVPSRHYEDINLR